MRSVMIVDDDCAFAVSLAESLQRHEYAAICVDTPERALAALREPIPGGEPIPVVLIDARLGGTSRGVDLISRLRAERPELVCVLMSVGLDAATAVAALRRGVYDCVEKSGDRGSLFAALDRCFDAVALQRERVAAIEALRRAKDAAEAASRGKSGFLATMSHELRTPLNAIIGFSEMMLHEVAGSLGNAQYRAYVSDIHDSGTHLLCIINDILDLSKAEAGKLDLHEEVFDPRDTIRSVRHLMGARMRDAGLSDAVELAADLPLLLADERKTKQVLLNLIGNAVKFTPAGGRITIVGRFSPQSGITLTVGDTGIGIAPDDLGRVLRPFEQVDSALTRAHPGTGLGLPLVKAIMERHGGHLRIDSEVGVGTRVSATFPASRAVFDPLAERSYSAA